MNDIFEIRNESRTRPQPLILLARQAYAHSILRLESSIYFQANSRPRWVLLAEEEKKLSVAEVRITISTSLATAFGFVIGLLWNNVVQGGLKVAGVDTTFVNINMEGWVGYLITAVILTVVMVFFIIMISRWGHK